MLLISTPRSCSLLLSVATLSVPPCSLLPRLTAGRESQKKNTTVGRKRPESQIHQRVSAVHLLPPLAPLNLFVFFSFPPPLPSAPKLPQLFARCSQRPPLADGCLLSPVPRTLFSSPCHSPAIHRPPRHQTRELESLAELRIRSYSLPQRAFTPICATLAANHTTNPPRHSFPALQV